MYFDQQLTRAKAQLLALKCPRATAWMTRMDVRATIGAAQINARTRPGLQADAGHKEPQNQSRREILNL
jgi:hypothetical protein